MAIHGEIRRPFEGSLAFGRILVQVVVGKVMKLMMMAMNVIYYDDSDKIDSL